MAFYMRALLREAMFGWSGTPVVEYGEDQMPLALFTDCRSLYDHVKVEGNVPDDRHDAVWLGALKSHVSCGPQRDESKAGLRWLPSRWMVSDGLTKGGLSDRVREFMRRNRTRVHEESAQAIKRNRERKDGVEKRAGLLPLPPHLPSRQPFSL